MISGIANILLQRYRLNLVSLAEYAVFFLGPKVILLFIPGYFAKLNV